MYLILRVQGKGYFLIRKEKDFVLFAESGFIIITKRQSKAHYVVVIVTRHTQISLL